MLEKLLAVFSAAMLLLLPSCGGAPNVVATGPEAYMVESHGVIGDGSGLANKADAVQRADDYCKSRGLQMVVVQTSVTEAALGRAPGAEVEFRCLKPDAQEYGGFGKVKRPD